VYVVYDNGMQSVSDAVHTQQSDVDVTQRYGVDVTQVLDSDLGRDTGYPDRGYS
jgi:hypothetical protein